MADFSADPYAAIGVAPLINAAGMRTIHGGTLMLPEVRAAMMRAAERFVDIQELMTAISARLSELTGAESGIVTSGASAALTLAAAGAIAGNDPLRMLALPAVTGPETRALVPAGHRTSYENALRAGGATIVEVADEAALAAALNEPAALVFFLAPAEQRGAIAFDTARRLANAADVPVLVDAAAEPLSAPERWCARGADMVVYSGGKHLRGPQASGMLLGKARPVEAAWRQASPHHGLGRGLKVGKEEAIGLLAAVEAWFGRDHTREAADERAALNHIAATLAPLGIAGEVRFGAPMRLRLTWDPAHFPVTGPQVLQALLAGTPRIVLRELGARDSHVEIDAACLEPGEADLVAKALAAVLEGASAPSLSDAEPPADIAGDWDCRIDFLRGARGVRMHIDQKGDALTGHHDMPGPVRGWVSGNNVQLVLATPLAGGFVTYRVDGVATDGRINGTATLGMSDPDDDGPDRSADQYGQAAFTATRRA
jgi:uncharacterized pyridoxal phosphate-dependent enzyme